MTCALAAILAAAFCVSAADTNTPTIPRPDGSALLKIGAAEAASHYDKAVIVTGRVAQVTLRPNVTFLNLDRPYPDSPFTVVIFPKQRRLLGDVNVLRRKSIEVRGKIKNYRGRPEIVLDQTNQLTVFGLTNWPVPIPAQPVQPATRTNAPPMTETNFPEIM